MSSASPTPSRTGADLSLGLIGNCAISALVDRRGTLVWACWPRFDGEPVFDALLRSGQGLPEDGAFSIELEGCQHIEQAYEPGTAVLRTRLVDDRGQGIEITDFAPRFQVRDRMFRPAQLVRRVRPLGGRPRVRVGLRPCAGWTAARPQVTRGSHHARFVMPDRVVRLNSSAPLTYVMEGHWFTVESAFSLMLGEDETLSSGIEDTARDFEEQTIRQWRVWTRRLAVPLEWQDAVIRAAITLKLCQYEETGAIVAAMTTSIPESAHSGRNWDYRFCWLRDAFFVVRALNGLSEVSTMEAYLDWLFNVLHMERGGHVQPLYGIGLERRLDEAILPDIEGYRGMGPVRVGNQAYQHFQHDVYGNIVLAAAQAFHDRRLLHPRGLADFGALEAAGEQAWRLHDQPDAGLWELRSRARVHTSSSLMCWAACDRLAHVAARLGLGARAALWAERATHVREAILQRSWNESRGAFVESFEGQDLDASVLLMGEVGFLRGDDPRFVRTVEAMERSLCDGPFMRRYEGRDDFGKPEVAFNICSFWRVDALARIGQVEAAREAFEQLLARRNHLGLLSEDTHPVTGELWGNFPQTYSMVGVIHGALRLSRPWESVV